MSRPHCFLIISPAEISEACFDPEGYRQVFGVLARRLQENVRKFKRTSALILFLPAPPSSSNQIYWLKYAGRELAHVL